MIRRTATPVIPTIKPSEQAIASTSNDILNLRGKGDLQSSAETRLQDLSIGSKPLLEDNELAQIRTLLQPPPIPGVENFGIPPPSEDTVDSELAVRFFLSFTSLKKRAVLSQR